MFSSLWAISSNTFGIYMQARVKYVKQKAADLEGAFLKELYLVLLCCFCLILKPFLRTF